MRVLVACECSNTVRDAFLRQGHDAYSCDIQRADYPNPDFRRHIQGDVRLLLRQRWDLVIAHPPCTHLANSGAVAHCPDTYQYNPNKATLMLHGIMFFLECFNANSDMVCVENPIMLRKARNLIGMSPDQIIQPWQFGHPYTKATCLWLRGLPTLQPTAITNPTSSWHSWASSESQTTRGPANTAKERSRTFQGIAEAMAEQWGNL